VSEDLVRILNGSTFVVCDRRGDIEASPTDPTGLFSFDTRFLSRWVLTVDGERLTALSTDDLQYFEARFFLVPGTGTVYVDAKTTVIRQRAVADGFLEQLTVLNHDVKPVELTIRIEAAADFADLFEVKDALQKKGSHSVAAVAGQLVMSYRRETFHRSTTVTSTQPAEVDEHGLTFTAHIEPHGSWSTELTIRAVILGPGERPLTSTAAADDVRREMLENLDRWVARAPRLTCDSDSLVATYGGA
jgi:glycogen debranching enzyme